MPNLVSECPKARTQPRRGHYRNFYTIRQNHVGPDYAMYANIGAQLQYGFRAEVCDRDRHLQAQGVVSARTQTPSSRVERYERARSQSDTSAIQESSPCQQM